MRLRLGSSARGRRWRRRVDRLRLGLGFRVGLGFRKRIRLGFRLRVGLGLRLGVALLIEQGLGVFVLVGFHVRQVEDVLLLFFLLFLERGFRLRLRLRFGQRFGFRLGLRVRLSLLDGFFFRRRLFLVFPILGNDPANRRQDLFHGWFLCIAHAFAPATLAVRYIRI
ncbi:hypothetical protein [Thalassobaculum litoreum]|uniref:hypothetical protein n=1 Tax=Thalassobaculum litoreum TaxID=420996 RepID=UPI001FE1CE99|nr:hypothetical protein [Thalassobaculum litoreum]